MDISGPGKSPNTTFSFRYNANNEELEELFDVCEDDPPTPQFDASPSVQSENPSPKRGERTSSILEKYFKSIRTEKLEDVKPTEPKETKVTEESRSPPKEVTSSPMKEYLNRLSKRNTTEAIPEVKEGSNETWKIFSDFRFKITQAVEDMKTRSLEETKEKSVPRDNSISDSEENSAVKDSDLSVGDTDNQVSSLDSSMQNLSELTQPLTAKAMDNDTSLPNDNNQNSESSDETHKNIIHSYPLDVTRIYQNVHNVAEVESGIEALEECMGYCDTPNTDEQRVDRTTPVKTDSVHFPQKTNNFGIPSAPGLPPNKNNSKPQAFPKSKNYFLNYTMYFLTVLVFLNYILFPKWNVWNGFLLGLWVYCFASSFKQWLVDSFFGDWDQLVGSFIQLNRGHTTVPTYTIPTVKEHRPLKKYEGWINHYRFPDYDPFSYRINMTTTAFMKLEGCNLRISYTTKKIGKRAQCEEKIDKVLFYQHRLYNLTGARIILLPKGLVRRRQWSKKYPICIILSDQEKIQVLEKESVAAERRASEALAEKKREQMQEMESTETNTSPEKKKKFVWRRRDKSSSHSDGEAGKEGLRHRLVRKMHRDKKTDSVSTCTDAAETPSLADKQIEDASFHDAEMELTRPSVSSTRDDEDELDETELSKIKDFLEEAELDLGTEGTLEGEWSLHVKHSRDRHARLYLFGRTGRDKHEWFRRLTTAIAEANAVASGETSATEEKTNESAQEGKEGIEMAVYKLSEKETVAFAKGSSNKPVDPVSEGVKSAAPAPTIACDIESQEKAFWPYMLKIIQSKSEAQTCLCRVLPVEVTWVNTVLARMLYDVMRDPAMSSRLQIRIQKKLHTLKLPSFMSPLVVTELSLAGACPMVEHVSLPTWDDRGLWFDADLRYEGGAYITILTQINLMKLKEKNVTLEDRIRGETDVNAALGVRESRGSDGPVKNRKPAIYDSEVEDSAESSSDEESTPLQPVASIQSVAPSETTCVNEAAHPSSKKKFLRMVDKIATNKYFQQVTDYKYVKRAMEGLSNTDIKLQLEVQGLEGRLALNLPPPPHDRLWIGFRSDPQLVLKARPAVGARTLRFAHISNWIEQKLTKVFEKVLVLPNMEDVIIDLMTPTPVEFE